MEIFLEEMDWCLRPSQKRPGFNLSRFQRCKTTWHSWLTLCF